jgi:hypothetical protein
LHEGGREEVRKENESKEEHQEKVRGHRRRSNTINSAGTRVGFAAALMAIAAVTVKRPGARIRPALAMLGVLAAMALVVSSARAADGATWRFAPAQPPPPPPEVAPAPYPVPLGPVGAISFWAPNRGLLISGGAGVYAYDGVSWHQLSTECGGGSGRIAWAGPDDFWTISDQRPGQLLAGGGSSQLGSLSLCHFENGSIVGSYAMPLEEPNSYLPMDAAACYDPNDCWFGGQDGQGSNTGAFHLHWNGSEMTAIYAPEAHAVADMVDFAGELYESVQIGTGDTFLPSENPKHPAVLHTIAPTGQASSCGEAQSPFCEVSIFSEGLQERLPVYGKEVSPAALQGFSLATDGSPLGAGATQLWAAASPVGGGGLPAGSMPASLTVLRYAGGTWSQILPNPVSGSSVLPAGSALGGAESQLTGGASELGMGEAIAPEPGSDSAWLSLAGGARGALVALLGVDGTVSDEQELPLEAQEPEPVGARGGAGPIVCPAAHDCWMATARSGWLFHLSDGTQPAADTDPFFDGADGVIGYRPPDSGVPVIYPILPPEDDSLANQQPPPPPIEPPQTVAPTKPAKARQLLTHVKSRLLHHRVLVVSFTLTARAHIQLVGRHRRRVVARSPTELLKAGRHKLSLHLNPANWPTGVQFKATPIGAAAPSSGEPGGSGSGDTIGT